MCFLRSIFIFLLFSKASFCHAQETINNRQHLVLITGCGRSATTYISFVLQKCGLQVPHEGYGRDGCVAWHMAVDSVEMPWGKQVGHSFRHVFHQVRNPLDVISSWQYNKMRDRSWNYIYSNIPQISPNEPSLAQCAKYWYYWNLAAEKKAEWRYRIEDLDSVFNEFSQRLGIPLSRKVLDLIPKDTNSRLTIKEKVTWSDLKSVLSKDDYEGITAMALRYGYPVDADFQQAGFANLYIDFDESIHMGFSAQEYKVYLDRKPQKNYLPLLKNLYAQSNFLTKADQPELQSQIPRVIHQIWLGSQLPERYRQFQDTWQKFHPDWEYRLWIDEDVKDFQLTNQSAFDNASNFAEKANIWRYEILDRYGGLYVDTDFECLRSFDVLHENYEFYTGIATINRLTLINNGLIGSVPGHPILKDCINNIGKVKYGHRQLGRNGTIYFGHMVIQACQNNPAFDVGRVFIAPPTYFYPWPGNNFPKAVDEYFLNSTFAVHYWDCTWKHAIKPPEHPVECTETLQTHNP